MTFCIVVYALFIMTLDTLKGFIMRSFLMLSRVLDLRSIDDAGVYMKGDMGILG